MNGIMITMCAFVCTN